MSTVKQALTLANDTLSQQPDIDARLEAGILLAHVLEKDRSWLYAWPEKELSTAQEQQFFDLMERRRSGEPIAYITGHREFWSLNFLVTTDTLIPRPETELLVWLALSLGADNTRLLDLGTGSGAIALSIASEQPGWQITATDQSDAALAVAKQNALRHQIKNVQFQQGSWYQALNSDSKFNIIVSNPPYVADNNQHLNQGDLRFEPSSALSSGKDGLDDLRIIISGAPMYLDEGGYLLVEHGFDQGDAVQQLFSNAGFEQIKTEGDLGNRERITFGCVNHVNVFAV